MPIQDDILTNAASCSLDACAMAIIVNARGLARLIDDSAAGMALPRNVQDYLALLTRGCEIRFTMGRCGRPSPVACLLGDLVDDGVSIVTAFLASEDEKAGLKRLVESGVFKLSPEVADPTRRVFARIVEMADTAPPPHPWLSWTTASSDSCGDPQP